MVKCNCPHCIRVKALEHLVKLTPKKKDKFAIKQGQDDMNYEEAYKEKK
jgi:hypothetical protein